MKKLLLSMIAGATSLTAFAQLPVSTSPQNKNVVLEEFTGIYCVYCPDGHLRASNFKSANPNDVVLINIHTGGFANPQAGDPDFRTPFGAAIAGQSNLTGYPAGTINRREFSGNSQNPSGGTAQSRGSWATTGGIVLGEASYVNMAMEADIDLASRVMTVDVQMYFTASGAPSNMLLNVALLQNNIAGPQTGGNTNPSQMLPDGQYNHQHMLRDMLTGQWGDTIATATGVVISRTYTYNIPQSINNVPVSLGDLEVAAFLTETRQTIVTGCNGPITYTAPAGSSIVDLSVADETVLPTDFCASSITPKVKITNTSSSAVDSVKVSYFLNGGAAVDQWYTAGIAANGSATVTFPSANTATGVNSLGFEISLQGVSGLYDLNSSNNIASAGSFAIVPTQANAITAYNDFEGLALGSTPSDFIVEDGSGRVFIVDQNITNPALSYQIGGWGASQKSLRFDFATIDPGEVSTVYSQKYNFSTATYPEIEFDYAYALRGTITGDQLAVFYSIDCGATWTEVWKKSSSDLATTSPTASNQRLYPTASQWTFAEINIPAIAGESEVLFKIEGTSGGGNALYFDNLNIAGSPFVGVDESAELGLEVYPNPAENFVKLAFDQGQKNVSVRLTNTIGQSVLNYNYTQVDGALELNISSLKNGVYVLEVEADGKLHTQRLVINK